MDDIQPPGMRDVSEKPVTRRTATAESTLRAHADTIRIIREGRLPKGDPLPVAKVAAIQAAKNTSQIIPYCHPLPVEHLGVDFAFDATSIRVTVKVVAHYKTGVEMEALTAAAVAALSIYDMAKMIDPGMAVEQVRLLEKTGGKSDFARAEERCRLASEAGRSRRCCALDDAVALIRETVQPVADVETVPVVVGAWGACWLEPMIAPRFAAALSIIPPSMVMRFAAPTRPLPARHACR